MTMTLPLSEVRNQLSTLVTEVATTHETVTITRNGVPAAVVISTDDYESIMETLALLNEPEDRARLAEADRSLASGDMSTGEEMAELMSQRARRESAAQ
ncbi:MAG: type II toxin-antitoxin system Phd/YefM family antitoxin [Mycobacteriales bacterium]